MSGNAAAQSAELLTLTLVYLDFDLLVGVLTSGGFAFMRSSNHPISFGNALTKLFIPITQATNRILILLQNPDFQRTLSHSRSSLPKAAANKTL